MLRDLIKICSCMGNMHEQVDLKKAERWKSKEKNQKEML